MAVEKSIPVMIQGITSAFCIRIPGIYHYVEITGNISDLCWNGDTYHNCIWDYLFCNLFPAVK